MMHINLIRARRSRRLAPGDRALVAMGAAVALAVGGMALVTMSAISEANEAVRSNNALRDDIDRMKGELGDFEKVKAERTGLLQQQKTIDALKSGRTGPVFVMRELSEVLTGRKGPTFDRTTYEEHVRRDPNIGFNPAWDSHRLWLESFEEADRKVRIQGAARTNEDVAELLKRLQLSVFFAEVTPESTTQIGDGTAASGAKRVSFNLSARVVY
ncbi:MAG TPA: PilN domain-containing protein [Polyangia bacterium]